MVGAEICSIMSRVISSVPTLRNVPSAVMRAEVTIPDFATPSMR